MASAARPGPLRRSQAALAVARWHDAAVRSIEGLGGVDKLPPGPAIMLRLRITVVESWFWRDEHGELLGKPRPFSPEAADSLREWTLPVQEYLRAALPARSSAGLDRLYSAF